MADNATLTFICFLFLPINYPIRSYYLPYGFRYNEIFLPPPGSPAPSVPMKVFHHHYKSGMLSHCLTSLFLYPTKIKHFTGNNKKAGSYSDMLVISTIAGKQSEAKAGLAGRVVQVMNNQNPCGLCSLPASSFQDKGQADAWLG